MSAPSRPVCIDQVEPLRKHVARLRSRARPIVLVPTMGDLHEGHLSLVRIGTALGAVIVSIFVNPTQFAPGEDYESYPRRLESDLEKLSPMGVAGVFAPGTEEMYPPGDCTRVEVRGITEPLCGAYREGHFLGVTTVCTKLFMIVQPDVAVFGQKDAQQCLVIHRLLRDLHGQISLVIGPTVREDDGLAMSSRNRYLRDGERALAGLLSQALARGRRALEAGERDVSAIEAVLQESLRDRSIQVDYAELRSVPDLEHPSRADGRIVMAVAARIGRARLLDNLCLDVDPRSVQESPLLDECTPERVRAELSL